MVMNEIDFVLWLKANNTPKKLCSDYISRIKRVERSIANCDIDEEYARDRCHTLLSLFAHTGKNKSMEERMIGDLPIGKYHLSSFTYSIRKYVTFRDEVELFK